MEERWGRGCRRLRRGEEEESETTRSARAIIFESTRPFRIQRERVSCREEELTGIDPSTSEGTVLVLHGFSELVPVRRTQRSRTSSSCSSPKSSVSSGRTGPPRSTGSNSSEEARSSTSSSSGGGSRKRLLLGGGIEDVGAGKDSGLTSLGLLLTEEEEQASSNESETLVGAENERETRRLVVGGGKKGGKTKNEHEQ